MTDYIPGQLSSLFTRGITTNSTPMANATVDAVKTKKKKKRGHKAENASNTTNDTNMDSELVALFDNSVSKHQLINI
jgi:hypothetical protein